MKICLGVIRFGIGGLRKKLGQGPNPTFRNAGYNGAHMVCEPGWSSGSCPYPKKDFLVEKKTKNCLREELKPDLQGGRQIILMRSIYVLPSGSSRS